MVANLGGQRGFYPAAKVKLILRLEEFNQYVIDPAKLPSKNAVNLNPPKAGEAAALEVVPNYDRPGTFYLRKKSSARGATPGAAGAQTSSADERTWVIPGIIPQEATWSVNSIMVADTLSLTLRWQDLPLDPRIIRSCAVEYYLGNLGPQQFAEGQASSNVSPGNVATNSTPLNILPDGYTYNGVQRTNLRFQGWVDKWNMTWNEGASTIKLDCRDQTQLFLDKKAPNKPRLNPKLAVDAMVADYLRWFPLFEGMTVEFRPNSAERPVLSKVLAGTNFQPQLGPSPSKGGGGSDDLKVWDYLTDMIGCVGHLIFVEGSTVVIQAPKTLINDNATSRPGDPYVTRYLDEGEFPVRTFVYGRNLVENAFSREYSAAAPKNVEVRVFNPVRKNLLVARFPSKERRVTKLQPGDGKGDQEWLEIRIRAAITDPKVVQSMAEAYYYVRCRHELEVKLKTRDLTSYGGDAADTDILDARCGDAIEVLLARNADGTVVRAASAQNSLAEGMQWLYDLGFNADFARAYMKAATDAGFTRKYVLRDMNVVWNVDQGIDIDITAANYLEARLDAQTPGTVEPRGKKTATPAPNLNQVQDWLTASGVTIPGTDNE